MKMIVQIVVTTRGKVYVRIFTPRRSLFYAQVEGSHFERRLPPPPGDIALAKVEQRTF